MNRHVYPKILYPEVYILSGGYCQYYKESGARCQPPAYVRMDDPNYAHARKEDLDQFRKGKFGRTKSYAYGEGKGPLALAPAARHGVGHRDAGPLPGPAPAAAAALGAARAVPPRGRLRVGCPDGG